MPSAPINIVQKSTLPFNRAYKNRIGNSEKWHCPFACVTKNSCSTPCSKAKYGQTLRTFKKDNLRLFTKTPRSSEKWKLVYKRRTSVERSNKREKIYYYFRSGETSLYKDVVHSTLRDHDVPTHRCLVKQSERDTKRSRNHLS